MTDRKVIAVVGARGAQGGGLARAILADPDGGFAVRGLTRYPDKEQVQALAAAGAEVVQADLDDQASLERRSRALTARSASRTSGSTSRPRRRSSRRRTMAARPRPRRRST